MEPVLEFLEHHPVAVTLVYMTIFIGFGELSLGVAQRYIGDAYRLHFLFVTTSMFMIALGMEISHVQRQYVTVDYKL